MSSVLDIMKKINKDSKNENFCGFADKIVEYEPLRFPSPAANYPIYKGLPRGRFIEISGLEQSGKTALVSILMAEEQRQSKIKDSIVEGKKVVFIDVEHTYDKRWAQALGVDLTNLIYVDPIGVSGEDLLTYATQFLEADDVSLVVLDSFAALTTQEEFEDADIAKASYKSMAKPIGKFLRIATEIMARKGSTLIGINQLRANIGNQYQPYMEPGGKALDFFNSMLIRVGTRKYIDENGDDMAGSNPVNPAGIRLRYKVVKNKVSPNNRGAGFITIRYRTGVDIVHDTLEIGKAVGLVRAGAWPQLIDPETGAMVQDENGNELKWHGMKQLRAYLLDNPQMFHTLKANVENRIDTFEELYGVPELSQSIEIVAEDAIRLGE